MAYPMYNQYNQYWQPQLQYQQAPVMPSIPTPGLNGKIVDSLDVVKVSEVPMGGYGIFPKADLSKIYVKIWDTRTNETKIIAYDPVFDTQPTQNETQVLTTKIEELSKKIDELITQQNNTNTPQESEVTF